MRFGLSHVEGRTNQRDVYKEYVIHLNIIWTYNSLLWSSFKGKKTQHRILFIYIYITLYIWIYVLKIDKNIIYFFSDGCLMKCGSMVLKCLKFRKKL